MATMLFRCNHLDHLRPRPRPRPPTRRTRARSRALGSPTPGAPTFGASRCGYLGVWQGVRLDGLERVLRREGVRFFYSSPQNLEKKKKTRAPQWASLRSRWRFIEGMLFYIGPPVYLLKRTWPPLVLKRTWPPLVLNLIGEKEGKREYFSFLSFLGDRRGCHSSGIFLPYLLFAFVASLLPSFAGLLVFYFLGGYPLFLTLSSNSFL